MIDCLLSIVLTVRPQFKYKVMRRTMLTDADIKPDVIVIGPHFMPDEFIDGVFLFSDLGPKRRNRPIVGRPVLT